MRRAFAFLACTGVLVLASPLPAHAVDLNPLHALCPERRAPSPGFPDPDLGLSPGGSTLFERYGYAGLQLTTWDEGCAAQIKTGGANGVNEFANAWDSLVNSFQTRSLDGSFTDSIDEALPEATSALEGAIWSRWVVAAGALAGLLMLLHGAMSRSGDVLGAALNVLVVLVAVPWVLGHPQVIVDAGRYVTTGVAEATADTTLRMVDPSAGPVAATALGNSYFQISYRAWLDASHLSADPGAAREFGPRFYAAQAYSVDEAARITADPAAAKALEQAKADEFKAAAKDLQARYPAVYALWKQGAGAGWGPTMKHLFVSFFAGTWIFLLSVGVLALRFMARFGLLLLAGVGVIMVVSQRLTSRYVSYMLTGLVGPAVLSILAACVDVMFLVVQRDPQVSTVGSITAGLGLGMAALLSLPFLRGAILGLAVVDGAMMLRRRHGRSLRRHYRHATGANSSSGGGRSGAVAGAAAGTAVDAARDDEPAPVPAGNVGGVDEARTADPMVGDTDDPFDWADDPVAFADPDEEAATPYPVGSRDATLHRFHEEVAAWRAGTEWSE